jgi:NAD(P)-dependent dehydrogenase (short-subunit alcohol dehydrogenase family)
MDLGLQGKVAVVTGAGKGIGLAITTALADEGAHVIAGSLTTDSLDGLKGVTPMAVDLAAPHGPGQLIQRAVDDYGRIDGAAKAALVNLTKALSQEFGPHGIRVNAVSPGPVATDLWLGEHGVAQTVAQATGVDADAARKTIIAGIGGFATGRFTTPEEVATLITFLASDRAGNITGANYLIDGGLIKTT